MQRLCECECVYPGDLCIGCTHVHEGVIIIPTTDAVDNWCDGYLDNTNEVVKMCVSYESALKLLSNSTDIEFQLMARIIDKCGIYPEKDINIRAIKETSICLSRLGYPPQDELIVYLDKLVVVREKQKMLTGYINTHANLYEAHMNCEYWEYLGVFREYL